MSLISADNNNFDKLISENSGIVLVKFGAEWCGPCQMLAPVLEEIASEYPEYTILTVDVDDEDELARRFEVESIPMLLIYKDGELVSSTVGYRNKTQILDMLEKL